MFCSVSCQSTAAGRNQKKKKGNERAGKNNVPVKLRDNCEEAAYFQKLTSPLCSHNHQPSLTAAEAAKMNWCHSNISLMLMLFFGMIKKNY
jgi:ribosomal protein RSM22 (predicted rRNA methylase)